MYDDVATCPWPGKRRGSRRRRGWGYAGKGGRGKIRWNSLLSLTGLSPKPFAVFWALRENAALNSARIASLDLAKETEKLLARFPNARVNADEQRQLRAALYRPLLVVGREERTKIVDLVVEIATQ
jgi:hypothetical protein